MAFNAATQTPTSTPSAYDLAVKFDAMRADLFKLRASIGKRNQDGVMVVFDSVLNCSECDAPLQAGEWISRSHTRNRGKNDPLTGKNVPDANFPGWQHWHITCPRNGNAHRLPGQINNPPTSQPQHNNPATDAEQAHAEHVADTATVSAPTPTPDDDTVSAIVAAVVAAINPTLAAHTAQTQTAIGILTDAIQAANARTNALAADLAALRETVQSTSPVNIVVGSPDADASYTAALPALRHENFALLVEACVILHRDLPKQANVWLVGPAGTGKSTAGEQLAQTLRYTTGPRKGEPLDFHYQGAIDQPYLLLGYADAHGNVVRTPMREAWEHGGVLMLDELDASSESATLAINGPLANGYCYFPVEPGQPAIKVMRHADCIVLGTANTNGLGADATYAGRNRLDGAFLSRFPTKIDWQPDAKVERTLTAHADWYAVVSTVRSECARTGTDFLVTSRDMMTGAAYLRAGMAPAKVVSLIFGYMARQDADAWLTVGKAARTFAEANVQASATA